MDRKPVQRALSYALLHRHSGSHVAGVDSVARSGRSIPLWYRSGFIIWLSCRLPHPIASEQSASLFDCVLHAEKESSMIRYLNVVAILIIHAAFVSASMGQIAPCGGGCSSGTAPICIVSPSASVFVITGGWHWRNHLLCVPLASPLASVLVSPSCSFPPIGEPSRNHQN